MTSKKNCCCGQCGASYVADPCTGTGVCKGSPMALPAEITVQFTPWWIFAWAYSAGGAGDSACSYLGPTAPTVCDGYASHLGPIQWQEAPGASITLTHLSSDSACRHVYTGWTYTQTPAGLDSFSDNPLGLSDSAGDWVSLMTDADAEFWTGLWGAGSLWPKYCATVTLEFERRDDGTGTFKNYLLLRLQIDTTLTTASCVPGASGTYDQCWGAFFGAECGCNWGTLSLSPVCNGAFSSPVVSCGQVQAEKWDVKESGTSSIAWSASRACDCCESIMADVYYYGYNYPSAPTSACPDAFADNDCGFEVVNEPGYASTANAGGDAVYGIWHAAEDYNPAGGSCGVCMVESLVYSCNTLPYLTDVSFS